MKGAAELVAAAHVADRREVGLDHAGQLGAWARLGDDAHSDQSIQSILHDGGGDHVDSCHGATFMLTVCDSDVGLTPDLHSGRRHSRAVTGHAVGTDRSCAQKSLVVLPFVFTPLGPAPYRSILTDATERQTRHHSWCDRCCESYTHPTDDW